MWWEPFKPFRSLQLQPVDAGILTRGSKDNLPSTHGVAVSDPMCWSTLVVWSSPRMRSSGRSHASHRHGRGCSCSSSLMGLSSPRPRDGQWWSRVVVRKPSPSLSLPPGLKAQGEEGGMSGSIRKVIWVYVLSFSDKCSGKLHRSLKPATRALLGWAGEMDSTLRRQAALHTVPQKKPQP